MADDSTKEKGGPTSGRRRKRKPSRRNDSLKEASGEAASKQHHPLSADLGCVWEVQDLGEHRLVHLSDHVRLLLVSGADDAVFSVVGRLLVWPLLGLPVHVSGVAVSWQQARDLGGLDVWSPVSHALHEIAVPGQKAPPALNCQELARRLGLCIADARAADALPQDPAEAEPVLNQRLKELLGGEASHTAVLCCRAEHHLVYDLFLGTLQYETLFGPRSEVGFKIQPADEGVRRLDMTWLEEGVQEAVRLCSKRPDTAIVIIGGKNTGKSTTVRHLANSLLLSDAVPADTVTVLDCDPGQTEFTPPAFLAATDVRQPLFGPPFSHAGRRPLSQCFLGALSPQSDPLHYLRCVAAIHARWVAAHGAAQCPLLVNTMGWPQGLGLRLLVDILRLVRPALVIQLCSPKDHDNFAKSMSAGRVEAEEGFYQIRKPIELDYALHKVEQHLAGVPALSRNLSPSEHRDLTLLSHMANFLRDQPSFRQPQYSAITDGFLGRRDLLACLLALPPRRLPWANLAIHVVTADSALSSSVVLLAVNASLVALVQLSEERWQELVLPNTPKDHPRVLRKTPVCETMGIGLIRGVDPVRRELLVISSLPDEALASVNCVLRGSVDLPACLWQRMQTSPGTAPYCDVTVNSGIGRTGIRKERAHLKMRKH